MKWRFFGAASVLSAYTLIAMGAPWYSVLAGIALAVCWKVLHQRGIRASARH